MAAFRLLTVALVVAVLAMPTPSQTAQPPAVSAHSPKVVVPMAVRLSATTKTASGVGVAVAQQMASPGEASELDRFGAGVNIVRLSHTLVTRSPPLLTAKRVPFPGARPLAFGTASSLALLAYGVASGGMSDGEAALHASALGASLAASAATVAGLYLLAATFGTASTGTAIGSLSGAAFYTAANAWLAGGAIAAGGYGASVGALLVTGGAAVVAFGAGVMVYKVYGLWNPAERDGLDMLVRGLLDRPDLTDRTTGRGSAILNYAERLKKSQWRGH